MPSHDRADAEAGRRLDEFVARARGDRRRDELDRSAIAALHAFESAGIEVVLLKGPVLAQRLYADGETRGYSDVDLLVRRRDLASAGLALTGLGYIKMDDEVFGIDDVADIQHAEQWARLGETGAPLLIDLHWKLDGCEAPDDLVWDALVAGLDSLEIRGRAAAVLDDDGLALHVALHAAQHGPGDAKAIGDLARGIRLWEPEVWRAAARLAEQVQAVPAFATGLRLVPEGTRIATELELPPAPALEWEMAHREVRPRGTFHLQAMARASGFRERVDILRRSLLPTEHWIQCEFPWADRSRPLLLLGYARHILRAPLWAVRAWRYRGSARRAIGGS